MKNLKITKLTLNVGAGTNPDVMKKGMKLLKNITGIDPVKTVSQKRIPGWGVRPGLPIGCKITLRGEKALGLIKRLLQAKDFRLGPSNFDNRGNLSFGIHEYIDVPDLEYDASIGIMGFQVCITLERPGYRVSKRKKLVSKIGKSHIVTQQEGMQFFIDNYGLKVEEE